MLKFNKEGNLAQNLDLSFREFRKEFGFNERREALIIALFDLLLVFKEYGVNEVYIVGSFVTLKSNPGDLDVCWNATNLDYDQFEKDYPEFFSAKEINRLKIKTGIHHLPFDNYNLERLDKFQFDRNGHKRGWVKISPFNLDII